MVASATCLINGRARALGNPSSLYLFSIRSPNVPCSMRGVTSPNMNQVSGPHVVKRMVLTAKIQADTTRQHRKDVFVPPAISSSRSPNLIIELVLDEYDGVFVIVKCGEGYNLDHDCLPSGLEGTLEGHARHALSYLVSQVCVDHF